MKIKEEFKKLIPPLTADEYSQLEANCISDGIRDAILTWNGFIIDGHNRYEISQKHNLKFNTEEKYFENENDVKEWMILNQFGRRNLSNYQRSVLALELEDVFKEKAKKKQEIGINQYSLPQKSAEPSNKTENETRYKIGKVAKVSHDTIAKVKTIQQKAAPKVKAKLETGEVSINQAYQEIKKEEKKKNFEEQKKAFNQEIKPANLNQQIIFGDSVTELQKLEKNKFDLLLTDPPYGMDFKSGWNKKDKIENDKLQETKKILFDVLENSIPLLKDDAHFYIFGNIDYLPEIITIIENFLTIKNILIWDRQVIGMGDLQTYGRSYDVIYFGYKKEFRKLNGTRDRDVLNFQRIDPSKNIHPTEKPLEIIEYLIKKSTNENDHILDPFAGGGSTLLAAKNLNRFATGIEINEEYYNLIKSRI
jgi:DNA modification methylase